MAKKQVSIDTDLFKRSVEFNIKTLYRKTMDEASSLELYNAAMYSLKDAVIDHWMTTQKAANAADPKTVYYMSMEFLMGRFFGNSLLNLMAYEPVKEALDAFIDMRAAEGERLRVDVISRAETILKNVSFVEERSPETVREYRNKLEQRIKELIGDVQVDEQRLLTETAVFADKIAVAEETVRLRSHIKEMTDLFSNGGVIGRKLDFIVQEMNREANTIGSKCSDMEITKAVVDIKAENEKIREQIQNIE